MTGIKFAELIFSQITPIVMIGLTEFTNLRSLCDIPLLPAIANLVFYGMLLTWARKHVLRRADVLLGRTVHY
jgi:hypothetical protein